MEHLADELDSLEPEKVITVMPELPFSPANPGIACSSPPSSPRRSCKLSIRQRTKPRQRVTRSWSCPSLFRCAQLIPLRSCPVLTSTQNLPPGCEFPPAPGFVKNVLGPWMFYWKYAELWKVCGRLYPDEPRKLLTETIAVHCISLEANSSCHCSGSVTWFSRLCYRILLLYCYQPSNLITVKFLPRQTFVVPTSD